MENQEYLFKSELIPLLIKYKQCIGVVFPIEKVKHLTTDIIIEMMKWKKHKGNSVNYFKITHIIKIYN